MLGALTKWHGAARTPQDIPRRVREALCELHSGRTRPVGIEIAYDALEANEEIPLHEPPPGEGCRLVPDPGLVHEAAAQLRTARFPVIYVGGGILASGASETLRALAERLQAPVVISPNGRGALSDRHPCA